MIFNLFILLAQGQNVPKNHQGESYGKIAGLFDSYSENDERALVFVQMYIDKAKKEENYQKLIRGYEEAIYYNKRIAAKLLYADSAIYTARKSRDHDQIARAYLGKGIIYFYNRRQYKPALDLYLTAYNNSKKSTDEYLKNKIVYHLGTVESYLGDYKEAASHFEKSAAYYEKSMLKNNHPNIKLNNKLGYFNSLYRLSTCYKNLRLYSKEDSLIQIGLDKLHDTKELTLEYGYFQKGKGVQLLRQHRLDESLKHLQIADEIISDKEDYASLTTVYFYLGKLFLAKPDREQALLYLTKVDSMVNRYHFITPEIRSAYEHLINDAKKHGDREKQLYFTDQLLKVDSVINADFVLLASKIHSEYDRKSLVEDKNRLEKEKYKGLAITCLFISTTVVTSFLLIRARKKTKQLDLKYREILKNYKNPPQGEPKPESSTVTSADKKLYPSEMILTVKEKLKEFEGEKMFLNKNLTLTIVAKMLGTNRNLLSYVLNDHLQTNFTMYLKRLRINYITTMLIENNRYLNYTVDTLADACGMANRKIFAAHFTEITGMKPSEFIRRRKEELSKP